MRSVFQNYTLGLKKIIFSAICFIFLLPRLVQAVPQEVYSDRYAAVVIDANSGKTLFQINANARRYPASLTKMMTLYLLFEAMQSGRVSPNTPIPISAYAASRLPTKMELKAGEIIPAEIAAKALITKSANDAAAAIGEYLGGSEPKFAKKMTAKARQLGMMNTHFTNASGLPDTRNYSTARDMSILSLALREHFPKQYKLFNTTILRYRGQTIENHNRLVKYLKGVDGIKTGYTRMSGSNLATSMRMKGKSLVAVVMGGKSAQLRDTHMAELLQRYLPRASQTKTKNQLLASRTIQLPTGRNVPIPLAKIKPGNRAAAVTAVVANNDTPIPVAKTVNDADDRDNAESISNVPVQKALVSAGSNLDTATSTTEEQSDDELSPWSVQIASSPSSKQATAILTRATATVRPHLQNFTPSTQVFSQKGKQFHRARFNGFSTRKDALNACKALKKAKFNCYTILNK